MDTLDSKIIIYADDTVIYCANDDVNVVENVLSSEMSVVESYCRNSGLFLNLKKGKTESMLLGTAKRSSLNGRELKIYYKWYNHIFC